MIEFGIVGIMYILKRIYRRTWMVDTITIDETRKILEFISKGYKVPEVIYNTIKKIAIREIEDKGRVVLVKRDPDIGSGRIQAMYVKIIDGNVVEFFPPAVAGFGADFDGDCTYSALFVELMNGKNIDYMRIHISEFDKYVDLKLIDEKEKDGKLIKNYKVLSEAYTYALDINTGNVQRKRILNWSRHENLEMYKFERRKRNSIISDIKDLWISSEHSIIVLNNKLQTIERKNPKDIIEDPKNYFLIRNRVEKDIKNSISAREYFNKGSFKLSDRNGIATEEELGYFFGVWVGDGYVVKNADHNHTIALTNSNKNIGNKWCDILENITKNKVTRDYNSTGSSINGYKNKNGELYERATRWYTTQLDLQEMIIDEFSCGSENKHLPDWILNTTEEFIIGFLAGYTDTDGTTTGKYVSWTTKSKKLAEDLKYVFWYKFGIDSSIGNNILKYNYDVDRHYYVIQIRCKPEYKSFFNKILNIMNDLEKKEKIEKCFENIEESASINNKLKYIPEELKYDVTSDEMAKEYNFSKNDVRYMITRSGYTLKNIPISDSLINKISSPVVKELMKKQENDEIEIIPCSCIDITLDPEMTIGYDLTVEDFCTFITGTGLFLYDSVSILVPLSKEAQDEAKKKMVRATSNEGIDTQNFEISKEMLVGIYTLTDKDNGGSYRHISSIDDLYKLDIGDRVKIKFRNSTIESTAGRVIFNNLLPQFVSFYNGVVDKKVLKKLLSFVIRHDKSLYADSINKLVKSSFYYATIYPQTVSLDMLSINKKLENLKEKLSKSTDIEEQGEIISEMKMEMMSHIKTNAPDLYAYIKSGASKGDDQVNQILVSKGVIVDPSGNVLPPIISSISEGYSPEEYFNSSAGARAGLISKALGTREGGYEYRKIIYVVGDVQADINIVDCGTRDTLNIKLTGDMFKRLDGRYVLDDKNKIIPISSNMIGKIIRLRSPIYCQSRKICRTCYGDLLAQLASQNTGIVAAQEVASLAERFMKCELGLVESNNGIYSMDDVWELSNCNDI